MMTCNDVNDGVYVTFENMRKSMLSLLDILRFMMFL